MKRRRRHWRWLTAVLSLPLVALSASNARSATWPFVPVVAPPVPVEAGLQPIDAFIRGRLADQQLEPSPPAAPEVWLRRVTYDLTGLPPTVAELDAFVADQHPAARERVVDRLLASPRYGEHMAQHWLDLVRYAETDGFNEDAVRPGAFRYRDYVISAFNDDLPYDRFISEQLAGDEFGGRDSAHIATGFLRLAPEETNAVQLRQRRQEVLDDIVDVFGQVVLGLTIGCARCHDHKTDDIPQTDYYRLAAYFQPLLERNDLRLWTDAEQREHLRQTLVWEHTTANVRTSINAILTPRREQLRREAFQLMDPVAVVAWNTAPNERTAAQLQLAERARVFLDWKERDTQFVLTADEQRRLGQLEAKLAEFDHLRPAPLPVAHTVIDAGGVAPPTFCLAGGSVDKPGIEVTPGIPKLLTLDELPEPEPRPYRGTTGRRRALAEWVTNARNPVTARVLVNRVWQWHFGTGIVATPNDFGATGDPPSHPELLDWLADDFVQHGFRVKRLQREIVLSATYGQASLMGPPTLQTRAAQQVDLANRLLWHAPRQRLTGEATRDAQLQIAGLLNPRMFGQSARPRLPPNLSSQAWRPDDDPQQQHRRSIYQFVKRNLRYPLFEVHDGPDFHQSCPRRNTTTTPAQALCLLNGELTWQAARHWAGRLLAEHPAEKSDSDKGKLVTTAYQAALTRRPNHQEQRLADEFLAAAARRWQGRATADHPLAPLPTPAAERVAHGLALVEFCHALFNSNEFVYLD